MCLGLNLDLEVPYSCIFKEVLLVKDFEDFFFYTQMSIFNIIFEAFQKINRKNPKKI